MPFSRRDGSTSFRIFISKEVCQNESADVEAESEPDDELHDTPELQKLYVSSESGYVSIPLFMYIF